MKSHRTGPIPLYNRQDTPTPPAPAPTPAPTPINPTQLISVTLSPPSLSGATISSASVGNSTSSFLPINSSLVSGSSTSFSTQSSSTATKGAVNLPQFKFVYLIPVIAVVGIILVIALIWLIQGCVTRKPKVNEYDPEAVGGPRYEFTDQGSRPSEDGYGLGMDKPAGYVFQGRDTTQLGYEHVEWEDYSQSQPSYAGSEAYVGHLRAVPSYDGRPSRGARSTRIEVSSPPPSDTTSLALLDMYESDEEKDHDRRQQEPWETLRHRSIKRGILDSVQKEKGWMDSVRAVAGSAFVNQGRKPSSYLSAGRELQDRLFAPKARRRESEVWIDDVRQRRANPSFRTAPLQAASRTTHSQTNTTSTDHQREQCIDVSRAGHNMVGTPWSEETGFKIVQESPIASSLLLGQSQQDVGINRGKAILRDYFNYKFPPADMSSVPMDHTIGTGPKDTRISMLPLSPPRIMSPPLENQLTFTPVPAPEARLLPSNNNNDNNHTLLTRLTDRKGKRKYSSSFDMDKPLPYPDAGHVVVAPLRPEKRPAKLVKSRPAGVGKYQPIPVRSKDGVGLR